MLSYNFPKVLAALCLFGSVLAHPGNGVLEERHNGATTIAINATAVSSIPAGCPSVTYLPGITTTVNASSATITTHYSTVTGLPITVTSYYPHPTGNVSVSQPITVTSYIPHPTGTYTVGLPTIVTSYISQPTGTVSGNVTTVFSSSRGPSSSFYGPTCSCVCGPAYPSATATATTFSSSSRNSTQVATFSSSSRNSTQVTTIYASVNATQAFSQPAPTTV